MKRDGWIAHVQESLSNFLDVKVKDNWNTLLSISLNSEELEVQTQWHIEMIRYAKLPAMNDLEKFKVIHEALIEICTLWALSSLQMKFMAEV